MSGETMSELITTVTTGLGANAMWGAISGLGTYIAGVGVFAFAYLIFRRITKGAAKGKLKV